MGVKSFGHVGLTVRNLEKALEFYHGFLGFEIVSPPSPWVYDKEESKGLGAPECIHRICSVKTPDGTEIEFMDYLDVESPNPKPAPVYQVGQHHLSFYVDSIEEITEGLKAWGCEFLYGPVAYDHGLWQLVKDPDGIIMEIMTDDG